MRGASVCVVAAFLIAVGAAYTGTCKQSPTQTALSGDGQLFTGSIVDIPAYHLDFVTGPLFGSMGRPGLCETTQNKYCVAYPRVNCIPEKGSGLNPTTRYSGNCAPMPWMPTVGLCVSKDCALDDLQQQTNEMLTNPTKENNKTAFPFQTNYGIGGKCSILQHSPACGPDSYAFAEIECQGEGRMTEDFTTSNSAIWAFALVVFFLTISFLGTVLTFADYLYGWYKTSKSPDEEEASSLIQDSNKQLYGEFLEPVAPPPPPHLLHPTIRKVAGWWDLIGGFQRFMTAESRNVGAVDTRYFEGLRTISMLFVIYGHTLFFPNAVFGFENATAPLKFIKDYDSIGVFPALLAVDTFFWLSGFLFMHLYMKAVEKKHVAEGGSVDDETIRPLGIRETLLMYLHRYLRLTPVVMFTLIISVWLLPYFATDATYHRIYSECPVFTYCHDDWWHQVLYIGNMDYKHQWNTCMGWFWYLNCDMQLFIVAPIFASLFYLHRGLFLFLVSSGIIVGTAVCGHYEAYSNGEWYHKTYMRFVPYLYGIAAAAVVRKVNFEKLLNYWIYRAVLYVIGAALLISTINVMWNYEHKAVAYDLDGHNGSKQMQKHHFSLTRFMNTWAALAWGLGLNIFAVCWTTGHGGHIKRFLSHPTFAVLSKLTFTCYMLHPIVLMMHMSDSFQMPQFTRVTYYYNYGGAVVWSFFSALCLYLVVEYPLAMANNALTKRVK